MSDDLIIAYTLGVEDLRKKLHKQADEIERLRAENEQLKNMINLYDEMVAVLLPSWEVGSDDDQKLGYMITYTNIKKALG